jgi:hypothetical protein
MALAPINPTQLTPPRVALIDERSGAISREWYRFFLSLLTSTQTNQQETELSPNATSLLTSYDAVFGTSIQDLEEAPDCCSATASLASEVYSLTNAVFVTPPDLGGTVTSVAASGGSTGLTFTGSPITTSGTLTLGGTLAVANGGTGATTAATARTNLGATTIGGNMFTLTDPSAVTFPRFNADNTISALDAATFRTAIGAGTGGGSVTSVSGTGTVNGITLTGTVTTSGSLTLGGTLSNVSLTTQVTGTLPVANGGTGQTSYTNGQLLIGNTTGNTLTKATLTAGTNVSITNGAGSITINATDQYVGTVTSVSVVSANGFAGTVATATTTPAITLTTTITGVLKGNGTAISAATQDVDYLAPSAPVTKTADFTVAAAENWIINNKSGSTCTVTLPSASSFSGRAITFQNYQDQLLVSASSNVVPRAGGAAGTAILDAVAGNWATLVSNGTNWVIMQAASFNTLLY